MMSYDQQEMYKAVAAGTSSGLSIIGSFYILGRYWYARRRRARVLQTGHHVDVTKELIHVLAWLDLIGAIGRVFGSVPARSFDQEAGEPVTFSCRLQAYVVTFGDGAPIAWNFLMAYNLFRWVCMGEDQQMLRRKIKWYILIMLVFALTLDTLAAAFDKFGDAGNWCWVVIPGHRTEELYWKLGVLYVWVLLGAVAMGILLILVKMDVQKRLEGVDNDDARVAYHGVVHNLTIYILGFLVCWSPAVLDRGYSSITNKEVFAFNMLHACFVPLQGFVNAVIYGKFHIWIGRHVQQHRSDKTIQRGSSKTADGDRTTESHGELVKHYGTATIFVTSFDLNWSPFPPNLDDWIPAGNDLYVFSLQHCSSIHHVEQAIRKHLLKINYPMGYHSITALGGSQIHGNAQDSQASVCQIVFVNNADMASGNFQFHAAEGRMWTQRKSFKDIVGIPLRYFEASIAFVSCDLSQINSYPDIPNSSQSDVSISSRHAMASSLIRSFGMDADRAAVDFPYLYHHTFLSGNLDYNLDGHRRALTTSMEQAYKAECLRRATDTATDFKLRNFGSLQSEPGRRFGQAPLQSPMNGPGHGNVQLEWNLLYFKSEGSLGRGSNLSSTNTSDDGGYEEIYTATHDGLPFTVLKSPPAKNPDSRLSLGSVPSQAVSSNSPELRLDIPESIGAEHDTSKSWLKFIENLLPDTRPLKQSRTMAPTPGFHKFAVSSRGEGKQKVGVWMKKSQMVAGNAEQKWSDLISHDELKAAMEAKEVFCGFEEPAIKFLPSYPRRVGVSASYSMLTEKSCKDVFASNGDLPSSSVEQPAYKDRILSHSLPDARERIKNVHYWLCEEVLTSSHKPVCSIYELEVDRFFAFKNKEAERSNAKAGKLTLKEKSDLVEYKLKLVNLDAHIWSYQEVPRQPMWRFKNQGSDLGNNEQILSMSQTSGGENDSIISIDNPHDSRATGSFVHMLDKMKRKGRSSSSHSHGAHSTASGDSTHRRGRLESLENNRVELVPVEPSSISTVFPLPSEDVYALQRKVHEVAHSVQSGFQSSAKDEETEESLLAYTNFRTVSWKEACTRGVIHSAITKAVNGVIHVAIKIRGEKGQGGQGILCIRESDVFENAAPVIGEATPIPFDVSLTWGGKHVGFLHGDILCGL